MVTKLLAGVLPDFVRVVESFGEPSLVKMFPEEALLVGDAVNSRQREFGAVRTCAREALLQLGVLPTPILHEPGGAPIWPAGVVGSLAHCSGYRCAAVAWSHDVRTIGIDAEPNEPLPQNVLAFIARPEDMVVLLGLPHSSNVAWDRLLFSAKEAVYKAWYPLQRSRLDFHDVKVIIEEDGTFVAHLIMPRGSAQRFSGQWVANDSFVATAALRVVNRKSTKVDMREDSAL